MWLLILFLGRETVDVTSGFRGYHRKDVQERVAGGISTGVYAFQEETLYRCQHYGFRILEIPITFRERRLGSSKLSWKDVGEFFKVMVRLRIEATARRGRMG